jgi:hypothetical protein
VRTKETTTATFCFPQSRSSNLNWHSMDSAFHLLRVKAVLLSFD